MSWTIAVIDNSSSPILGSGNIYSKNAFFTLYLNNFFWWNTYGMMIDHNSAGGPWQAKWLKINMGNNYSTAAELEGRVSIWKTNPAYPLDVSWDINTNTTYKIWWIDYWKFFIDSTWTNWQIRRSDWGWRWFRWTDQVINVQCPPKRVMISESVAWYNGRATYESCDIDTGLTYLTISYPKICNTLDCKYIKGNLTTDMKKRQLTDLYCEEFWLAWGTLYSLETLSITNESYYSVSNWQPGALTTWTRSLWATSQIIFKTIRCEAENDYQWL